MKAREFYNATAAAYDARHHSPATRLLRAREEALVRRFARGTVLDVGCGTGAHLRPGWIGLDVSERMLSVARKRFRLLVQAGEHLPAKSSSFDTVVCFFTVLNMADAPLLATEFHRILRPGGRVLLSVATVHDHGGRPSKTIRVGGQRLRLRLFTEAEVRSLFSSFTLEQESGLFSAVKPRWGSFQPFSLRERARLSLERGCEGAVYLAVFKKGSHHLHGPHHPPHRPGLVLRSG